MRSDSAVRLVRRNVAAPRPRVWGADVRALFDAQAAIGPIRPGWRPWQVLGGPGTGKTTLLIDLAADRIAAGADPESVLVLTHSKQAASALRDAITARLTGSEPDAEPGVPGATREPLVRTLHSYAFSVLRRHATAHGNPPPRLLTGAEQDAVLREMLRGDLIDIAAGATGLWPERLQPALSLGGFAEQLRDLMLRATERGLGPEDLVRLGREHARPEWVAAGKFAVRYEQTMLLRWSVGVEAPEATAPALDAAELVGAALDALAGDANLLAAERARIRYLLVDDAQHLDPQAALLIRVIGNAAQTAVVAGDPDQGVFTFRGADTRFVADLDTPEGQRIILRDNHRSGGQVELAVARIAAKLPGSAPQRFSLPRRDTEPEDDGSAVRVRVLATPAKEAGLIADYLRRAHLTAGVPWSRMAVIVRSVPLSLAPLRRALLAAGVPVQQPALDAPLARRRGAAWMLLALRAALASEPAKRSAPPTTEPMFSDEDALDLVGGPLGGADQISLRRLRRGIRRSVLESQRNGKSGAGFAGDDDDGGLLDRSSAEVLRDLLIGIADRELIERLTDVEAAPLRRVLDALDRARTARRKGAGLEDVMWALWTGSRLERRWVAQSERGGAIGMQADRDLDAVVGLFDAAAAYVDRLPRASVEGFVEYLLQQEIPHDTTSLTAPGEAVALLSAHAAAGREWDVVAVAAVQEGIWPNPRPRGTLLGNEDLVDVTAGIADAGERVSRAAPILAEERRLLLVACSRARQSLLVTAVESVSGDRDLVPSRFLAELLGHDDDGEPGALPVVDPGRALVMHSLVAEMRGVVCDSEADPERRRRAAHQLARLASAGIRGTHPEDWYGTADLSSSRSLWDEDDTAVALSPSTVELLRTCPLRWALERHGGTDGDNPHAVKGNLVHTLVQALAGKVPEAQVQAALDKAWQAIDPGTGWHSRQELRRTEAMLETFMAWVRNTRGELTQAGVEVPVDCVLPARAEDERPVRIRGRVDRLERDALGRFVIVDVKTGKSPVTKQAAADHAQLATYQVAAAMGALDPTMGTSDDNPREPGDFDTQARGSESRSPALESRRVTTESWSLPDDAELGDVAGEPGGPAGMAGVVAGAPRSPAGPGGTGVRAGVWGESGAGAADGPRAEADGAAGTPEVTTAGTSSATADPISAAGSRGEVVNESSGTVGELSGTVSESGGPVSEPGGAVGESDGGVGEFEGAPGRAIGEANGPMGEPGGARLVYVAKPSSKEGATQRMQLPLDAEALEKWRGTIHDAAAATQGPSYLAMRNDGCRHCSVAGSCPVQDTGRQVTDE
ncbi:PD-(D/E)XK nuclease family protein [Nocardia sp. NPDC057440]|uniref:PD-(D/E)XK nuclease family protein n=1 Tax=Nocardia sp. NPDC057440 TaxID=3346134 RepID=UPI00367131D2